jgi:hypothetical protein
MYLKSETIILLMQQLILMWEYTVGIFRVNQVDSLTHPQD